VVGESGSSEGGEPESGEQDPADGSTVGFLQRHVLLSLPPQASVADPDPDPHVLGLPDPDPSIVMQKPCFYYFVTLFDFLSLKNDVNVASKCNKQKKLC
jgi:hypothetical protein